MLALLLAASCLKTAIPEMQVEFTCPAFIQEIRIEGDHSLLEEYVRLDGDRSELPSTAVRPMLTAETAEVARAAHAYIAGELKYPVETFQFTVEDSKGRYICSIRMEDSRVEGDCAGAGKP